MPSSINSNQASTRRPGASATHTVKAGETLSTVAAKVLGSAKRWPELYELNKGIIGADPNRLRAGMVLKLPQGTAPAPSEAPKEPQKPSGKTLPSDRFEPTPQKPHTPRGEKTLIEAYGAFVERQTAALMAKGIEIDCADLAAKLLTDFCKENGIPNPFGSKANWRVYRPEAPGGLPNVHGPNYFLPEINADNLAKGYAKPVSDANGNGVAGFNRATGEVDVGDLRAGDILFYDWDRNGIVNHTVNVLGVEQDGTVHLAFGTYNNLGNSGPVTWENLDLQAIQRLELKPGTDDYKQWLGEGSSIHSVRRFKVLTEPNA